jgi:antirestriction protein ArdC
MEELVAELGAAFLCADLSILCADLSITNTPRPDHAAYIANWLEVLRRDKRAIFTAARKAAQASDYLVNLQQKVSV